MNFYCTLLQRSFICMELEVMQVCWSIDDWCQGAPRPHPSAFHPLSFIYKHSASSFLPSRLCCVSAIATVSFSLFLRFQDSLFPKLPRSVYILCAFFCLNLFLNLLSETTLRQLKSKQGQALKHQWAELVWKCNRLSGINKIVLIIFLFDCMDVFCETGKI